VSSTSKSLLNFNERYSSDPYSQRQAHIAYWKEHNRTTDPKRFEDGFNAGWCDAENPAYPDCGRDSMLGQRQDENVKACGSSDCEWAFGDG
jgi:hypothetical protein